jgi:hypothetical protein
LTLAWRHLRDLIEDVRGIGAAPGGHVRIDPTLLAAVVGGQKLQLAKHISDTEFIQGAPPTMWSRLGNACIGAFRAVSPSDPPANPPTGALGVRG